MEKNYSLLPRIPVKVKCGETKGGFEGWRHAIGHGGINRYPLPPKVRDGLAALKPRLVRTFIQEYFNIYPEHGKYDWSLLDPYMESLAASGAKIVACICVKPKPLYPELDQNIVTPNDIEEWKRLIRAMVTRYSVEKKYVSHWEIANEPDIGENGGCPYLTPTPESYNEYYRITQEAVLAAFPEAKVGGPALAYHGSPLMEGLVKYCSSEGVKLDFVSWHLYSDNPSQHAGNIVKIKALFKKYYPENQPEMLITEMSKGFDDISVEECAYDGFRAAAVAASVFEMMDAGGAWSFYYHVWDQVFVNAQFKSFFSDTDIMLTHWNKIPHRFGLFGVCCEIRPAYYFYKMLSEMDGEEVRAESAAYDLKVKAAVDKNGTVRVMYVNYDIRNARDAAAETDFYGVGGGLKLLTVYRADAQAEDKARPYRLAPVERRFIDVSPEDSEREFFNHIRCPANSVTMVVIENVTEEFMRDFWERA